MAIDKGQVYGVKGSKSQADFIRISSAVDGVVEFHPLAGGWTSKATTENFLKHYEHIPEEVMREVLRSWSRIMVDTDSMDAPIPAWSNGTLWNGWQVPYFERQAIEQAIANGALDCEHTKVVLLDDAALEILSIDGTIPVSHDWTGIVEELRAGGEVYEREIEGCVLEASLCLSTEIEVDGAKLEVFAVGNGWCWNLAEAPEATGKPGGRHP